MARLKFAAGTWAAFVAFIGALLALSAAFAQTPDPLQNAERSVVRVVTVSLGANGEPISLETGSGFAAAPGVVVTNRHMAIGAPQASQVQIFVIPAANAGGHSQRVTVMQMWADADLALLSAPGLASPPLTIAQSPPGKEAIVRALGYPGVTDEVRKLPLTEILRPQEPYVTPGSIALFSTVAPGGAKIDTIFHTAPINPGNSRRPADRRLLARLIGGQHLERQLAAERRRPDDDAAGPVHPATQSSVLAKFLASAKVKASFSAGPCVPAAAPGDGRSPAHRRERHRRAERPDHAPAVGCARPGRPGPQTADRLCRRRGGAGSAGAGAADLPATRRGPSRAHKSDD